MIEPDLFERALRAGQVETYQQKAKSDRESADLTQIPYEAERRLGLIFKEGLLKYGRGNWRKGAGDFDYQMERANHALKHLKIYLHQLEFGEDIGEPGEDNLAKVAWFCVTQMEIERLENAIVPLADAEPGC